MHSESKNIHYFMGNAKDISFLQELMCNYGKWDVIVDFMIYSLEEFQTRKNILLANTCQYVFLSSARVYADSKTNITEQSDRLLDTVDNQDFVKSKNYAIAKAQEENLLFDNDQKNWTIVRPYITYSNTKLQLGVQEKEEWLYRALHNRAIVFSEDMVDKVTSFTHGKDVAKGIFSLLGKKDAYGEAFNITYNEFLTWNEILCIYVECLKAAGYKGEVVYVKKADELTSNIDKVRYDRIYNRKFDNKKIGRFCDCTDFICPEKGICLCMEAFLENPQFSNINWITQARLDRITNERAQWKEIPHFGNKVRYFIVRYLLTFEKYENLVSVIERLF